MTDMFGKGYSSVYDAIYQDKDYAAECNYIEQIIRNYHPAPVKTILDLGCGTGNHAIRLAQRGYAVTGVDRSPEMLGIAQQKSRDLGLDCIFSVSDICTFESEQKFDVVIMMFAVLGYITGNEDINKVLSTVQKHLNPGGLFICDVWYGPAVLHQKPGDRIRVIDGDKTKIIRVSSADLDTLNHIVTVHFRLWKIEEDCLTGDISEEHRMRFFFPQELIGLLERNGLDLVTIRAFPDIGKTPDETTWSIILIGKNRH